MNVLFEQLFCNPEKEEFTEWWIIGHLHVKFDAQFTIAHFSCSNVTKHLEIIMD